MAPIKAFKQARLGEAVAVDQVTTKMEKQLKAQILDADVICVSQKAGVTVQQYRLGIKHFVIGQRLRR